MSKSYEYLDHTADVLFIAKASNLEDLFEQCALAVENTQVEVKLIEPKIKREINLEAKSNEDLLFEFLDELLFYKDSERLIFSKFEFKIENNKLKCTAWGDEIDFDKHDPKVDVKAITMHMFELKKTDTGFEAKVLIDI
jgi:SHS2 domain-containing protein